MPTNALFTPGSHVVEVDGMAQTYHVAGTGPVCVVHPGGPGASWAYMRMPALEEVMTVVYLEPIGTGSSGHLPEHPQGYTISRYSQQLGGFLRVMDLHDVFLLGQSHGGFVAQEYALAHPERLAGVILCNTSAVTGPEFMLAADAAVRSRIGQYTDDAQAAAVLRAWTSVPTIHDDASYTAAMRGLLPMYFADPQNPLIQQVRESLVFHFVAGDNSPFDVRASLPSLAVPALIIVGTQDFICGPQWGDTISAALPSATRIDFSDCGHLVHVERPAEFVGAVIHFVSEVERRRPETGSPRTGMERSPA